MQILESEGKKYTNIHGLPPEIVRAILKDRYTDTDEAPFDESSSTLTAPTQAIILTRRHKDDRLIKDVTTQFPSFHGAVAHQVLEDSWHESMSSEVEIRYYESVEAISKDGLTVIIIVSGKTDCFDEPEIRDYKNTKAYKMRRGDFSDWEAGQNVYGWLLRKKGRKVERLNVWALIKDFSKGFKWQRNYPKAEVVKVPLKLWSQEAAEAYVKERVQRLVTAAEIESTEEQTFEKIIAEKFPCSKKEMWQDLECYQIMKKGAKRSTKNFDPDQKSEAQKYFDENFSDKPEYELVEKWNKRTKCLDWCDIAHLCHQNKILLAKEGNSIEEQYADCLPANVLNPSKLK